MTKPNHKMKSGLSEIKVDSVATFPIEPMPLEDSAIRMRAYQIHNEKGGLALDNWLEAERLIKNTDASDANFINEGNPNTQNKILDTATR